MNIIKIVTRDVAISTCDIGEPPLSAPVYAPLDRGRGRRSPPRVIVNQRKALSPRSDMTGQPEATIPGKRVGITLCNTSRISAYGDSGGGSS